MTLIYKNENAFTLIELLIVVSIMGILAGVVLSVINPMRQRAIASDAVTSSTLNKLAEGVEAYYSAESRYPTALNLDSSTPEGRVLQKYINLGNVPQNIKDSYKLDGDSFSLCAKAMKDDVTYFVYVSNSSDPGVESAKIFECDNSAGKCVNDYACPAQ